MKYILYLLIGIFATGCQYLDPFELSREERYSGFTYIPLDSLPVDNLPKRSEVYKEILLASGRIPLAPIPPSLPAIFSTAPTAPTAPTHTHVV